jgi:hypothetical protein
MGCKAGWLDNSSANSLNFDNIKDYPAGFRLVSLALANYKRTAIAFGISPEKSKLEVVRLLARNMKSAKTIDPSQSDLLS